MVPGNGQLMRAPKLRILDLPRSGRTYVADEPIDVVAQSVRQPGAASSQAPPVTGDSRKLILKTGVDPSLEAFGASVANTNSCTFGGV
jgi:hypothetical protein